MEYCYVRDYLFNWLSAHVKYTKERAIPILDLNARYYYDDELKGDRIIISNNKELGIDEVSSGMQSVIPLFVYVNYITKWIFEHDEETSYDKYSVIKKALIKEVINDVDDETVKEALGVPELQKRLKESLTMIRNAKNKNIKGLDFTSVTNLMDRLERPHFAKLIIEEPELSLFPQTQVRLIYDLLKEIDFSRDNVLLTTHSPYILYAINNCMMAHKVGDSLDEDDRASVPSLMSSIDPSWVSVWQTNEDGTVSNIKTSPLGLIGRHYFNEVMNDTLDEYHIMLDYV